MSIASLFVYALLLLLLEPILTYLWDSKKLRRFPNQNKLSGITNLGLHELHTQHPIVRIGPNSLSFSTPSAIRSIYGHSTPCVKGDNYVVLGGEHPHILDTVHKGEHARKRRLLSHAFATRHLVEWEFKIVDAIGRLIRQFERICDEGEDFIDFRKWSNLFTIEAIANIALSHRLGCLDRGNDYVSLAMPDEKQKQVRYIEGLHAARRPTAIIVWSPGWYPFLRAVLEKVPGFFRSQWKKGEQFDEMVANLTRQRLEKYRRGEQLDDLVSCLLEDKERQSRDLPDEEIKGEVSILMDAGSDTTAIALTHIMYYLLRTPAAFARLREEIHASLDSGTFIAPYDSVKNLPYLRACIDESMRLSPPLPFGLNRKTSPGGMHIDGHWIPGNTTVAVPAYTAHRNPELFPEPEVFKPERWLDDGAQRSQTTFIPFSTGARGCIGRNISYMEQLMLVATLIHRYDFEMPEKDWEIKMEEAFLLWPESLPLKIRRRDWENIAAREQGA